MDNENLLREMEAIVQELERRRATSKLTHLEPYPFQIELLSSSAEHQQTLLMAANRVGKSMIGAANLAYHATGLYPDWWRGHRWKQPIECWAAGVSAESTRDILQRELIGLPSDPDAEGTGMIPKDCIGRKSRKPQVPDAIQSVLVKHHTDGVFDGWSNIAFKAFEQGDKKFMGSSVHEIWLDEQPPDSLFGQCVTRTANTGGHLTMTFTPEDGVTAVVAQFTRDLKPGQKLIQATWEDAPHLTEDVKKQLLEVYGEHEREMRTKGIPLFGSGPVFPVPEGELIIEPFQIPMYWKGVAGLDFGWDHPTACVWLRYDAETDTVYITDVYRKRKESIAIHAAAINARPRMPVAWPHDGMKHETGSGVSLADQYRSHGVKMLPTHFTNPVAPGESAKGNYKVEPGINALLERMQTDRLKVFSTCAEWFEEYRMYHREDGKVVAINDDLMSATRYACQSLRFAEEPSRGGGYGRGFDSKLDYEPMRMLC